MSTIFEERETPVPSEKRILSLLTRTGPQTLEQVTEVSGLSWSQMFLAIDRLSRTGDIVLQRTRERGYQVSTNKAIA